MSENNSIEIWKDIENFPGYQVSNLGRVQSLNYRHRKANEGWRIKTSNGDHNYFRVFLSANRKVHTKFVHQLVAIAFLGPIPEGMEVNHKDGNKRNNHAGNLEYVTRSRNNIHAYDLGLRSPGEKHMWAKLTLNEVVEIKRMIKARVPMKDIAEQFGVCPANIYLIRIGKNWRRVPDVA